MFWQKRVEVRIFLTFNFIAELHIILSLLGTAKNLRKTSFKTICKSNSELILRGQEYTQFTRSAVGYQKKEDCVLLQKQNINI